MSELIEAINELITAPTGDLARIEHTLTDGYARALSLEAEGRRIERRIADVTHELGRGDASSEVEELTALAGRLDANRNELESLRRILAALRRVAERVRLADAESAA
jgi:uncharacterized membrane-anchored protein